MLFKDHNKCLDLNPKFLYDEACLNITNFVFGDVVLNGQYSECHKCTEQVLAKLGPLYNTSILINTKYPLEIVYNVVYNATNVTCRSTKNFYEHYIYGLNITLGKCLPTYILQPAENAYLPILSAFIILFSFGTIWYVVKGIYRNSHYLREFLSYNRMIQNDLGDSSVAIVTIGERPRKHPQRIKSIDVFRGLCLIVMLFVNYGGGQYWFFKHSVWNGLTVADLVFPWFVWIMGLSLSISLRRKLRQGQISRRNWMLLTLRRSAILILLGVIINSNQNLQTIAELRFTGVLQRLGVVYLIIGLLELYSVRPQNLDQANLPVGLFDDLKPTWIQWFVVLLMLVIHTCITFFVEVPGCDRGYLGPGGLDDYGKHFNCTGGIAGYIDRQVFGEHIYKHSESRKVYENVLHFDPEGLLSTLTAVFLAYSGVQAGHTLNKFTNVKDKVIRWVTWSIILCLLGGALCEFQKDDGLIPLNKQLWSLSFVLVLSGMAFFLFAFLFVVVDITRKWGGRPFFYPGMNSIALYVGHELFRKTFPFAWTPSTDTHAAYLFMNLWATAAWVTISIVMYKYNVFIVI